MDRSPLEGLTDTGERLSAADGERIVRLVAHHVGVEVHTGAPRVSAELPETGERFEGLLPPCRRGLHPRDYVAAGIMAEGQAEALRVVVAKRILASLTVMVCMALPMDMKRADRSFQLIRLTQLRHTGGNFPGKVRHLRTHGAAGGGRTADFPLRRLLAARARRVEG